MEGLISKSTERSVAETIERFCAVLRARGIAVFAVIDHSGEAEKVGLKMPPTKLVIFGNPKVGTPVMQAAPTIALDLPLKVLVWQDASRAVWISFDDPSYLERRHRVPAGLVANISVVEALVDEALA